MIGFQLETEYWLKENLVWLFYTYKINFYSKSFIEHF